MNTRTKSPLDRALAIATGCLVSSIAAGAADLNPPWAPLFDGQSLQGLIQRNGTATYRVEDGCLVGRTSEGSPNSFLCTTATYSDFELSFEVLVDDALNSGVQIRSASTAAFKNHRVHGPQVEIAVNGSAGCVYGEGLDTGWLSGPGGDPVKRGAFRRGEWNHYLVRTSGPRIQTWVNGLPVVDFEETTTKMPRGFIGFQVHGIRRGDGPYEVRWRNIRIRDFTPRRVVFIGAGGGHGGDAHQHLAGNHRFAEALKAGGLNFETFEFDGYPDDPQALAGADAVVFYCNGGGGHLVMPHLDAFDALMRQGVGLVCLHYAVEVPAGRPGDLMLDWIGGYFETDWSVNPVWTASFDAIPVHPATRGVEPFTLRDEWYYHMKFRPGMQGVTPLLSAHPPRETLDRPDGPHENNPHVRAAIRRGEIQHLAWAYERPDERGGGRGFGTTAGHWHKNWDEPSLRTLVVNAIAWAAGAPVPEAGFR